jgi:DNA repair exonuclease SbcCD ATPase subunit
MPTCEGCGEEFAKGGAFQTHVQYCDDAETEHEDEEEEKDSLESRVAKLEQRTEEHEHMIFEWTQNDLDDQSTRISENLQRIEKLYKMLEKAVDSTAQVDDRLQQLNEVVARLAREQTQLWLETKTGKEFDSYEQAVGWAEVELEADFNTAGSVDTPDSTVQIEQVVEQMRDDLQAEGQSGG